MTFNGAREERREPTKKNKIILFLFEERKSEVELGWWLIARAVRGCCSSNAPRKEANAKRRKQRNSIKQGGRNLMKMK